MRRTLTHVMLKNTLSLYLGVDSSVARRIREQITLTQNWAHLQIMQKNINLIWIADNEKLRRKTYNISSGPFTLTLYYVCILCMSHHYARRRLKYTEILQHDVSKTGREKTDFIFHI